MQVFREQITFLCKNLKILWIEHHTFFNRDTEITDHNININKRNFFDHPLKSKKEHMVTFKTFQMNDDMITLLDFC